MKIQKYAVQSFENGEEKHLGNFNDARRIIGATIKLK